MRNTAVKEICKQIWLYMDCLDTKKKRKPNRTKTHYSSLPSFHHQNALYYFPQNIHHIQALKAITKKKKKKIKENHQKSYQAI